MRVTTVWPRCRKTFGSRACPTPAGVPVTMRSPGVSVMNVEMYSMSSIGPKQSSRVLDDCITAPSTMHSIGKWAS